MLWLFTARSPCLYRAYIDPVAKGVKKLTDETVDVNVGNLIARELLQSSLQKPGNFCSQLC